MAHELAHGPASLGYHTYRIEWIPTYIAFFVDGIQVRRETEPTEYAALFDQDASGHVPQNELMELRTGVWSGNSTIWPWSGVFDGSTVPTAHFVDYVKIWAYTPNQSNAFATVLLDQEFSSGIDWNIYYPANWSFSFSASDYTASNLGTVDGFLVAALTTSGGQGFQATPPP